MKSPQYFINEKNINASYLSKIEGSRWKVPDDFSPSSVRGYKTAYASCIAFLLSKSKNKTTKLTYLCEVEKFLQWCLRVKKALPSKLSPSDLVSFIEFCKNPPSCWISNEKQQKSRLINGKECINKKWRPFVRPRQDKPALASLRKTYATVSSYYKFLCRRDIINADPFLRINPNLIARSSKNIVQHNALNDKEIRLIESKLDELVLQCEKYTRERFIVISLLYMNIKMTDLLHTDSEPVRMLNFVYSYDGQWYFKAMRSKIKGRLEPANKKVMDALVSYRRFLKLENYPSIADDSPLLLAMKGRNSIRTNRIISEIITKVLNLVIVAAKEKAWNKEDLKRLRQVTPSWFKYTKPPEE